MWKAAAGHNVQLDNNDDDDWETDPDFVVSIFRSVFASVQSWSYWYILTINSYAFISISV